MRDLDMLRLERRVGLLLVPHDEGPGVAVGVARDAELLLRERLLAAQKLNLFAPEVAALLKAIDFDSSSLIA